MRKLLLMAGNDKAYVLSGFKGSAIEVADIGFFIATDFVL